MFVLKKMLIKTSEYIIDEVKNLNQDTAFLVDLDRFIYVNPQYLSFLPSKYNYRVLWVKQDLDEVLKSEYKLLGKKLPENTIPLKQMKAIKRERERERERRIRIKYLIG